jgi:predicted Zn-dependent protease
LPQSGETPSAAEPVGTLEVALRHARELLGTAPELAVEQAEEILAAVPGHPPTELLLAQALAACGLDREALERLDALCGAQPRWAAAHLERGLALSAVGRGDDAIAAFRTALGLKPDHPEGWRLLGDHLLAMGDTEGADAAYARHVQASTRDPQLLQAARALVQNNVPVAERLLRDHLKRAPTDVAAIRMLAEVAARIGRKEDAEKLLARCVELAPSFAPARFQHALMLYRLNRAGEALAEIRELVAANPREASYRNLHAVILTRTGDYAEALALYERLVVDFPGYSKIWLSYGHVLKTEGRIEDAVRAYRRCIELNPAFGEAYWSLANLKTFRFSAEDEAAMRAQIDRPALDDVDRLHFEFALGKAREDAKDYAQAFAHYDWGNTLNRCRIRYDADLNTARIQGFKKDLTREFFAARAGFGCTAPDPIFIVGMPRAGSTLLEQILSSHSAVEGTMELPEILNMVRGLRGVEAGEATQAYGHVLATLGADECRRLGEQYLANTRVNRKTSAPFFIDKMPNNFIHIGLIHLALPNAKIIDARRHPMGCCFSNFKQHYARGQNFSYGLEDLGRYYSDYVEFMAHMDEVLPGRVHRVFYERMVEDTEAEVRRLLDYCGLPFEEGCLRFFENDRPVRTASSEQVRQPIYRDGVEQWLKFEQWLDPLKTALGPVLEAYPAVPRF